MDYKEGFEIQCPFCFKNVKRVGNGFSTGASRDFKSCQETRIEVVCEHCGCFITIVANRPIKSLAEKLGFEKIK